MKRIVSIISIMMLFTWNNVKAQINIHKVLDSILLETRNLNFMVPDIPAFLALEEYPAEMLKPSAPRDLAVMFSSFRSGGKFIIPRSFAAEFAPWLFASTSITLHDYQTKYVTRMLTKTRLSLASEQTEKGMFGKLAAGIKLTLLDKGDYRSDTAFLNKAVYSRLDEYESLVSSKKLAYLKSHNITALELANNESLGHEIEDSIQLNIINQDIRHSIDEYKRTHWNASRMEVTYTALASSQDTLLQHAHLSRHLFWLVYAIKPGKNCNWAQVIFGFNEQLIKSPDNTFYNQLSLNSRVYFGTNKAKGFAEAQYTNLRIRNGITSNSVLINAGIDVCVYSGIWIHLAGGIDQDMQKGNSSRLIGNMKIYIALPENFRFF